MDKFEHARHLIAGGDYHGALREYEAINRNSDDERALCGKALAYIILDMPDKAAKCMKAVLKAHEDAAYPYGIMGVIAEEASNMRDAADYYDSMMRADPSEAAAYIRKAQILLHGGLEKECANTIKECAKNIDLKTETPMGVERLHVIIEHVRAGQIPPFKMFDLVVFMPGLRLLLDRAVGDGLPCADGLDVDAASLGTAAERSEVIENIGKSLDESPNSSETWCAMGELLYGMGRADEATACYERASRVDVMLGYGFKLVMLQDAGDRADIFECLDEVFRATPKGKDDIAMQKKMLLWRDMLYAGKNVRFSVMGNSSAAVRHLARRRKRVAPALRAAVKTNNADPADAGRDYIRAELKKMIDGGDIDGAISMYKSMLELRKRIDARTTRRQKKSARRAKRSTPAVPDIVDGRLAKVAQMLDDDDSLDDAVREYKAVAKQHPRDERALCGIALACVLTGEFVEATKCMRAVLKLQPDAAYPHGIIGAIAQETNDWDAALTCYDSMILADPSEAAPYVRKAQILLHGGRHKECIEAINRCAEAASLDRETPRAVERLHSIIEDVRAGRTPAIKTHDSVVFVPGLRILLDRVVGEGLPMADGLNVAAISLGTSAERVEAIDALGQMLEERGFADAWCAMGELLHLEGRIAESLECYDRAIEIKPGNIDAYSQKLAVLQDIGDLDGIMVCLDEVRHETPEHEDDARMQDNLRLLRSALREDERVRFSIVTVYGAVRRHMERRRSQQASRSRLFPPGLVDEDESTLAETARHRSPRRQARR